MGGLHHRDAKNMIFALRRETGSFLGSKEPKRDIGPESDAYKIMRSSRIGGWFWA